MDKLSYLINKLKGDKMILVTNIEYKTVPCDWHEISNAVDKNIPRNYGEGEKLYTEAANLITHIIQGETYWNNKGQKICIGISPDVKAILGLPMETFRELQNSNESLRNKVEQIHNLGFWKKLKFLFFNAYKLE